jgi:hypothetical protein
MDEVNVPMSVEHNVAIINVFYQMVHCQPCGHRHIERGKARVWVRGVYLEVFLLDHVGVVHLDSRHKGNY